MTPEEYRFATGVSSFVAFFSLLYLFYWQVRIWPDDRQKWAATIFVLTTLVVVGQLCLSYLEWAPPMGSGPRGAVSFMVWAASAFGLAIESHRHIRRYIGQVERARRAAGDDGRFF